MTAHLPGCTEISIHDALLELGVGEDELGDRFHDTYFERCVDGCPVRAQVLERAREIAKEHGWVT